MAFTGVAVIKKISDRSFRITGLSLAAGASGTISLDQGAGDVKLTAPGWGPYQTSGTHGGQVGLNEAVKVTVIEAAADGTTTENVGVVKAGADADDFLVTLTSKDAAASGALEIYVELH